MHVTLLSTVSLWIRNSTRNDIKCPAKFEDTKEVIRSRKSKGRQYNANKRKKQLATKHVVHRKLKIEQHEIRGIVTEYPWYSNGKSVV